MPVDQVLPVNIHLHVYFLQVYQIFFLWIRFEAVKRAAHRGQLLATSNKLFPTIDLRDLSSQLPLDYLLEDIERLGTHNCDAIDEKGGC